MDDLLYVLLGIGWLIYTIYSGKQKMDKTRREAQQTRQLDEEERTLDRPEHRRFDRRVDSPIDETPSTSGKSLLDEIFGMDTQEEELDYEEEYEAPYEKRVFAPTRSNRENTFRMEEAQSQEIITEEVPADYFTRRYEQEYNIGEQQVNKNITEEENEEENWEKEEEFDLRKGIIYSEILRAPYITG